MSEPKTPVKETPKSLIGANEELDVNDLLAIIAPKYSPKKSPVKPSAEQSPIPRVLGMTTPVKSPVKPSGQQSELKTPSRALGIHLLNGYLEKRWNQREDWRLK